MPLQAIDHITLDPPVVGTLVSSARRGLRNADGTTIDTATWLRGVAYNCRKEVTTTQPLSTCIDGCPVLDCWPDPCEPDQAKAYPIRIGSISGCLEMDPTNHNTVARQAIERDRSAKLAKFLWDGLAGTQVGVPYLTPTSSLASLAQPLTSGAPLDINQGIAALDIAMRAQGYYGPITFHAVSALKGDLYGSGIQERNNVFRLGDDTIIADPGYPGTAPTAYAGPATPANVTWLYASGPVEFDFAEVDLTELNQFHTQDCYAEVGTRALQFGIVRVACWPRPVAVQVAL